MKIYYTHEFPPLTAEEIQDLNPIKHDKVKSMEALEVPYFAVDPNVPLRYDDEDLYDATSMTEMLYNQGDNQTLGVVLLVDKQLVLSLDSYFTDDVTNYTDFIIYGLATPFLVIMASEFGLTKEQFKTILRHEFGHYYGLPHCTAGDPCIMVEIESLTPDGIDEVPRVICDSCVADLSRRLEV